MAVVGTFELLHEKLWLCRCEASKDRIFSSLFVSAIVSLSPNGDAHWVLNPFPLGLREFAFPCVSLKSLVYTYFVASQDMKVAQAICWDWCKKLPFLIDKCGKEDKQKGTHASEKFLWTSLLGQVSPLTCVDLSYKSVKSWVELGPSKIKCIGWWTAFVWYIHKAGGLVYAFHDKHNLKQISILT